jgi:hypothetical protein
MCVREQEIDNKNVGRLTDDNLRALEVPIGKFSLFRDKWRGLAVEACTSQLVIRACACSLCAVMFCHLKSVTFLPLLMFAIVSYNAYNLLLLQVACKRFNRKAVFLKWDDGFITLGFGLLAHGSTIKKTIARAIEEIQTDDDKSKCLQIEGCRPEDIPEYEGRRHVMKVSFAPPPSVPACFFAFETAEIRDKFMKELQARLTSGT